MHILTLNPTLRHVACCVFPDSTDEPSLERQLPWEQLDQGHGPEAEQLSRVVRDALSAAKSPGPDAIALRVLYGGERFARPALLSESALAELALLLPQAPLHLPRTLSLAWSARDAFPTTPIVLVFETSFFLPLPERERRYGLDPDHRDTQSIRRYGFHGIFHEAACQHAARRRRCPDSRLLSICLEPRPELAACVGRRPVMATGGNTLVEGLPGESSCGDLDPSVVLKLAHDGQLGPEQTGQLLTRHSGMRGLAGRPVSLAEMLQSADAELRLARAVFRHAMLRACGAGIAAMGGIDAIVYSGRHAAAGDSLHAWLHGWLRRATRLDIPHFIHTRSLAQQLRDIVHTTVDVARLLPSTV